MKSSTDSLPQDTDFHESVGPESLPWTDGGNPVPPGQPVWGRPLQGSLQITHVAGIPVASWPDLAEGVPSPPLSRGGAFLFAPYTALLVTAQRNNWYWSSLPVFVARQ